MENESPAQSSTQVATTGPSTLDVFISYIFSTIIAFAFAIPRRIFNFVLCQLNLIPNHKVGWDAFNPKKGTYERERESVWHKFEIFFLFSPFTQWISRLDIVRAWCNAVNLDETTRNLQQVPPSKIKAFVDYYGIDMSEYVESDASNYLTFEKFLSRKHKPRARHISEVSNHEAAVACMDSKLVAYDSVAQAKKSWLKGYNFSITNLVMDVELGKKFEDGNIACFRISPQDCGRIYAPVSGEIKDLKVIPGVYHQLDGRALRSKVDALTQSTRKWFTIASDGFGTVLVVAIGGAEESTIDLHNKIRFPGSNIMKGDCIGHFTSERAVVLVVFRRNRIEFDAGLLDRSKDCIQTSVKAGVCLGRAMQPPSGQSSKRSSLAGSSIAGSSTSGASGGGSSVAGSSRKSSVTFADDTNLMERSPDDNEKSFKDVFPRAADVVGFENTKKGYDKKKEVEKQAEKK